MAGNANVPGVSNAIAKIANRRLKRFAMVEMTTRSEQGVFLDGVQVYAAGSIKKVGISR